jgi:prepilin-type N-terminal cleavage/methylation domain-containing protein
MNFMKKTLKNGFTLVELMIVVAIIAILSAVAVPRFGSQIQKAKDAKALALVGNWRSASTLYYTDNEGVYATSYKGLAEHVDSQTKSQSFTDVHLSTEYDGTTSPTSLYFSVGTSTTSGDKGNYIEAKYNYSSTDSTISIEDAGENTSGKKWSEL